MRLFAASLLLIGAGMAAAQTVSPPSEARLLADAKREAEEARARSEALERQAARATDQAAKARAAAEAAAERISSAEAAITAAEARIRIVEALRRVHRERLAERQRPAAKLGAALQTMARRPAVLALVQPGSVSDIVHVRALLASTLPEIRRRTARLRQEAAAGDRLRTQAETARRALLDSRRELEARRIAFARLETEERRRSASLASLALGQSDRALAFTEEARDLSELMATREYQASVRESLSSLPGPLPRPGSPGQSAERPPVAFRLPVAGEVVTGTGELSASGVHARGLTLKVAGNMDAAAPARGRVVYAGPFRSYGQIVIIDHGRGWTSLVADLEAVSVRPGQRIRAGRPIGRSAADPSLIRVELRQNGQPVPITSVLQGA